MHINDIERIILETPIVRKRIPYRGELEDEIEVDDGPATLAAAVVRVREFVNHSESIIEP